MITILSVFPDALDLNGDAQNALVLARRARWAGLDAEVVEQRLGVPLAAQPPDLIVVGSGAESSSARVLDGLLTIQRELRAWLAGGVPLLAVGTGWELLSKSVEFDGGLVLEGLGIFSGHSVPRARVSDDLVVDSEFGRLIGFENHAREYRAASGARDLGTVIYGVGNAGHSKLRREGEIVGASIGTHLHGPVLAKNPALADHLLGLVTSGGYDPDNETARRVDASASAARNQIAVPLGLAPE
ncbi:MAG: type 1 glutamine amidotransferase [Rhodoglobus sp.]